MFENQKSPQKFQSLSSFERKFPVTNARDTPLNLGQLADDFVETEDKFAPRVTDYIQLRIHHPFQLLNRSNFN